MRTGRLTVTLSSLFFLLGLSAPATAQTCLIGFLCVPKPSPSPSPVPAPPPPPTLPPADSVTDPVTDVGGTVGGVLRTPVSALEGQMLNSINADRVSAGIQPLAMSAWAQSFARNFSEKMMAAGSIWHNPDYFAKGRAAMGATLLSENVGYDSSIPANHLGFMRSPAHRANILDGRLTHVGIGVAVSPSGRVYVTEDFARIPGGGSPGAPSSAPAALQKSPGAAGAPSAVPVELADAGRAGLEAETISLGRPTTGETGGDSIPGSEAWRRTSSPQSPAPMIPGLVAGGLAALAGPFLLLGKSLPAVLSRQARRSRRPG